MSLRTFSLLAFVLVFGVFLQDGPLYAQSNAPTFQDSRELPEGIIGDRIEALIAALNANDASAVERVLSQHATEGFREFAPMSRHISVFKDTYRQTGGVDFYGVRSYEPPMDETIVIIQDRIYGDWHALRLEFEPDDDQRISGIRLAPARRPHDAERNALTESELTEEIRRAVERGCEQDVFSGSVLVARRESVLFETACGEASKRFGAPNNVDTKFNIGSMNKMFTAVAVMQLVEQQRIALEDPISRYVDESWLPRDITDRVTIHHLLTHTSGLGSYFNEEFVNSSRLLYRELDDYKPLVVGDTLAFEPGERFRYSNTGMLLLGVVIESVTDTSYFDYVREHIYRPAGMVGSDSYSMDEPVPNLAIGYIPDPESEYGWRNNTLEHVLKGGPAGGGYSTVRDLHRFAEALLSGALVSDESLAAMWTDHSGVGYGYGFGIQDRPSGDIIGHSGGFPGLNGNLDVWPDSGFVVAVLSNHDRGASPLARYIQGLINSLEAM